MKLNQLPIFSSVALLAISYSYGEAKENLNIAKDSEHPYVEAKGGRENHRFTDLNVNEVRVYDFYQRQADYYMANPDKVSPILPSFPGLDGGKFGHWGKNNQNKKRDERWQSMGQSQFSGQMIDKLAADAISIKVDEKQALHTTFSAKSNLSFLRFWKGEFVQYDPFRWGTSRGASPSGKDLFIFHSKSAKSKKAEESKNVDPKEIGWQVAKKDQEYLGFHDADAGVIFSYKIKQFPVLDRMSALDSELYLRTLEFSQGLDSASTSLYHISPKNVKMHENGSITGDSPDGKNPWVARVLGSAGAKLRVEKDLLFLDLKSVKAGESVFVYFSANPELVAEKLSSNIKSSSDTGLSILKDHRKKRWQKTYSTQVTLSKNDRSYVVDDFGIPFKNDNNSLMFFTDIAFNSEGVAFISTLQGEVWKVVGLGSGSSSVTWHKIATGLNQPFGLKVWDGKIHVLEREQVTRLEDRNGDGEIDFYANFTNCFEGYPQSHTTTYGLERDSKGYVYLIGSADAYKISPDGKTSEIMVRGLRNCMGFGKMSDDTILIGPQEGTHTPASTIIEIKANSNYGFRNHKDLTTPLGYVPRGIDNSTGGFLEVDSKRWGPLGSKGLIGLCYGSGTWYQILFDENAKTTKKRQIATVPMLGDFASGVTRGAVNPVDGQVYLVGLDGWGDYATQDGCLHRVRYTGKSMLVPIGYEVFDNGIKVNFTEELDASVVANSKNYFSQMWNYFHSRQYGSPEYLVSQERSVGHDHLVVKSARLLADGKSIFVEIPQLQPAMQVHLRMHLKSKSGVDFKTDIFPTIVNLGEFNKLPGLAPKISKNREFKLPNDRKELRDSKLNTRSGRVDAHARVINIKTVSGLKFDVTKFKVKAGESLALKLKNVDSMPHNLVITKPGKKSNVGEAAFKMMNDPKAIDKHYVPDNRNDVITFTHVISPKGAHTSYFTAPKEKGEYPYICTFPGHWQVMQGVMVVE